MASIRGLVRSARHAGQPVSGHARASANAAVAVAAARTAPKTTAVAWAAWLGRRSASSQAGASQDLPADPEFADLESESSLQSVAPVPKDPFKPLERARQRKGKLPGSRYQYHPPKYDRGPLHPVQSPPSSDPVARDFVPGPFHLARLKQTYHSTVAPDLMTLGYTHVIPGTEKEPTPPRLRGWDDSSPYHKNRPLRGPRGGDSVLRPLERPITFRNIPEIRKVTVAAYQPLANREPERLTVARMVLQAVTGVVPEVTQVQKSVAQWHIIKGQKAGAKATVYGNEAYDLLDKCIHLVFPRIKDWRGIEATTGDSTGNLAWGFTPEHVALFPEVEANYTMYPAKMVPGFRMFVETTAKSDRHARLLLEGLGVPFYGKIVN